MPLTISGSQVAKLAASLTIPPCPAVLNAFLDEAHQPSPRLSVLEGLALGDVGIAAMLLKSANHNAANFPVEVMTVRDALDLLGIKTVSLAVAVLAGRNAVGVGIHLERFWERSHLHAIACAHLARHFHVTDAETAYTFGLFNDCGIPIMAARYTDYKSTLALANDSPLSFKEVENQRYSTNHTKVGSLMARNWQLPDIVCQAIADHHSPELFEGQGSVAPEVVSLIAVGLVADFVVAAHLHMPLEADWLKHGHGALAHLGVTDEVLDELVQDAGDELAAARKYRR